MLTLCWAVKGGAGTTVVAAGLALAAGPSPSCLLVDLGGALPLALGVPQPAGPGLAEWLASDAEPERLAHLEVDVAPGLRLLPRGHEPSAPGRPSHSTSPTARPARWEALVTYLRRPRSAAAHTSADDPGRTPDRARHVVVDAGTGAPPPVLLAAADRRWLVTRNCYLGVHAAVTAGVEPTGVILIDEPGRRLGVADVEAALGAPVVALLTTDPAIARAVDAGLVLSRVPGTLRRALRSLVPEQMSAELRP